MPQRLLDQIRQIAVIFLIVLVGGDMVHTCAMSQQQQYYIIALFLCPHEPIEHKRVQTRSGRVTRRSVRIQATLNQQFDA